MHDLDDWAWWLVQFTELRVFEQFLNESFNDVTLFCNSTYFLSSVRNEAQTGH